MIMSADVKCRLFVAVAAAGIGAALFAVPASSADTGVRETLDSAAAGSTDDLLLQLYEGAAEFTVGEPLGYTLRSDFGGYCYLIHVDVRDRATLLRPEGCSGVQARGEQTDVVFPSSGRLTADFPAGEDAVYGVLSPMPFAALDRLLGGQVVAPLTVADATTISQDISRLAEAEEISLASVSYQVLERAPETQYTTRGIIRKVVAGMENPGAAGELASFDLENIQFDFGSDKLTAESKRQLDVFGAALRSSELTPARLKVAGHTDRIGDEAFNDSLSLRRANSVRSYLMSEFGLDPARLDPVGYGETAPLVEGDNEETRALNRRVEMLFIAEE